MKSVYLLTGAPSCGKTTLIRDLINGTSVPAGGFYTQEIRSGAVRQGFRIITLDGRSAPLARKDIPSLLHVGKYGVDCTGLEEIGVPALKKAAVNNCLVVIDEIGKMELFSDKFKETVLEIIENGKRVLGTIMLKSHPWSDMLKKMPQVEVIALTRGNRDKVYGRVQEWIKGSCSSGVSE
jgi:nucleoside-triphosphatase